MSEQNQIVDVIAVHDGKIWIGYVFDEENVQPAAEDLASASDLNRLVRLLGVEGWAAVHQFSGPHDESPVISLIQGLPQTEPELEPAA